MALPGRMTSCFFMVLEARPPTTMMLLQDSRDVWGGQGDGSLLSAQEFLILWTPKDRAVPPEAILGPGENCVVHNGICGVGTQDFYRSCYWTRRTGIIGSSHGWPRKSPRE